MGEPIALNFYYWFLCFLGLFLLGFGLFILPWAPKYPVIAKVENDPKLVKIKSPQSGFVTVFKTNLNMPIVQGEPLFRVDKFRNRIYSQFYQQKRKHLEINLKKIRQEIRYQLQRLERLRPILQHQAITEDYYHQQLAALEQLKLQYKQQQEHLTELQREQSVIVQAPISGYLHNMYVLNHNMVTKDEQLMMIAPKHMHWRVHIDAPIEYQSLLKKNTRFNFCLPSDSKFKRYLLQAKLMDEPFKLKHSHQQTVIRVKARFLNTKRYKSHLINGLPLQGYLMGESRPLIWWLWHFICS